MVFLSISEICSEILSEIISEILSEILSEIHSEIRNAILHRIAITIRRNYDPAVSLMSAALGPTIGCQTMAGRRI